MDAQAKRAWAMDPSRTREEFEEMVKDRDLYNLMVCNPSVPEDILCRILPLVFHGCLDGWLRNPNRMRITPAMDEAVLNKYLGPFNKNSTSESSDIATTILPTWLCHTPNLDTIMRFRYHKRWIARWAVAINPHTPLEVWSKMVKDRSSHVRNAALTRLGRTDLVDLLGGVD